MVGIEDTVDTVVIEAGKGGGDPIPAIFVGVLHPP